MCGVRSAVTTVKGLCGVKRGGKDESEIPTIELFDAEGFRQEKQRPEYTKSVAQGKCPKCTKAKIGLVRQGEHLVWRHHTYRTWQNAPVECPASGVAVCVLPEGTPAIDGHLRCKHG